MYGHHVYYWSTCGQGFNSIHPAVSPEICAQCLQKILKIIIGGHYPEAMVSKWCPRTWIYKDFPKIRYARVLPAPTEPNTMRQTMYLDPKAFHEKKFFFRRNHFFALFSLFSALQNPKFRDLGDPAMCPSLLLALCRRTGFAIRQVLIVIVTPAVSHRNVK